MQGDVLPESPARRGDSRVAKPLRALAATMLVYALLGVIVVTLSPFEFRMPHGIQLEWHSDGFDIVANVAMMLVPGFLFRAVTGPTRDVYCIVPALLAMLFAVGIEAAQLAVPGRCASLIDVTTNTAGAWFGAMTYDSIRRHIDPRIAGKLLLELPLTGLLYLLAPMLWLDGFASIGHMRRIALALPLGLFGAVIVAAVWFHRLRPAKILTANGAATVAAAWFLVAASPILEHNPYELAALALTVFAAARVAIAWPGFLRAEGSRFEVPTLRRVGPLFLGYLVVLALWPFAAPVDQWRGEALLRQIGHPPSLIEVARLLEWMAAFTLGGYMAAESLGRTDMSALRRVVRAMLPLTSLAAAFEMLRGWAPDTEASALRFGIAVTGAGFGASVYCLQLSAIRAWIAERTARELPMPVDPVIATDVERAPTLVEEALAAAAVPGPTPIEHVEADVPASS